MAKKRFSRLKYALKSLQSPLGGTNNDPITGSILANYKDFRDGKKVVDYSRESTSHPGSLVDIAINPFFQDLDADKPVYSKISNRVLTLTNLNTTRAAANIITTIPPGATELKAYTPAKATVFLPATQSDTKKPSQITGVAYNPKEGASFTIPYGKKTGELYENVVRASILTAVKAISVTPKASVTFTSEKVG